jgi:DNA ligase-associated metallophosphoesterase
MDTIRLGNHDLVPRSSHALWWPARQALLVADLHLEKASYLASHGQFLPPYDSQATLDALASDIAATGVAEVWCLGDSFHDPAAFERLHPDVRLQLRRMTRTLRWTWITGNHDPEVADDLGGQALTEAVVDGIALRHEAQPSSATPEISGHYHPKLWLRLRGRLVARRCFAVAPNRVVLPAFGAFTGGLDITDAAFRMALGPDLAAVVPTARGLFRYPVATI